MAGKLEDLELLQQCKKKNRDAIKELYLRFGGFLLAICVRYMGSKQDAEDVLQDSFLKILKSLDKFKWRGNGSLRAWLARFVVNECLQKLRKKDIFKFTVDINDIDESNEILEPTKEDIKKIPYSILLDYIAELPEGYRTIFNMYVFENKSHKEIAKILNIKEKSSSSQFFRARKLLSIKIEKFIYTKRDR